MNYISDGFLDNCGLFWEVFKDFVIVEVVFVLGLYFDVFMSMKL